MLVVGRIIAGLSVGLASAIVPVYQSEITPPAIRGRLVSLQYVSPSLLPLPLLPPPPSNVKSVVTVTDVWVDVDVQRQWSITWGILLQYFIEFGCSYINGNASFRIPWGLQMIPAILLSTGMLVFPESPRWLFDHGRCVSSSASFPSSFRSPKPPGHFIVSSFQPVELQIEKSSNDVWNNSGKLRHSKSSLTFTAAEIRTTSSYNSSLTRSGTKSSSSVRRARRVIWICLSLGCLDVSVLVVRSRCGVS